MRPQKITNRINKLPFLYADPELRRTLWSLVAFPKLKKQVVLMDPTATQPKDFAENTLFWINNDFAIVKNGKVQRRGKVQNQIDDEIDQNKLLLLIN